MKGKRTKTRVSGRPRRGVYILPNLLTTASLFCGFYGLVAVFHQDFHRAALAVVASFLFDGLDGRIARATRTTSPFGLEYDSLADLVAFGVTPAVLVFLWALAPVGRLGWLAAFLYTACGALRLARFNVEAKKTTITHFRGLPIPAAAGLIATMVLLWGRLGLEQEPPGALMLGTLYLLSFLMVSNIPYRSFKDMALLRQKPFQTLVASVLLLVVILIYPPVTLFLLASAYVISGPVGLIPGIRKAPVPKEEPGNLPGP